MLIFKTSEGVYFSYLGMFRYLSPVFALHAAEFPTGSELLGVKWNNPLVPPTCRESFVSKELKSLGSNITAGNSTLCFIHSIKPHSMILNPVQVLS